ncbi:MAG: protein kinase [Candidatus Aminicenantes bacterium]|nr:protein kinase [Candidatus Aminicenantes bacterium]
MIKINEKIGHFLIQAEIGRGGMGTIYHAIDTMLNREVALKAIHPQLADNQQLMDRFKIEAMTQARMNHPNIVTIFSFNKIDDQYIIAMEYVDGKSLKEVLQARKMLSPSEAISIIIQVAEGLVYAHAHNVIHRDIKPANILLAKDSQVKISDFGIAKIFGSQGLTKTGMMMGTPWYTPPEQIMGKHIDFRADLYSLGVTFYELVTSRVPFDSETNSEFQIQKAHLETPPPRPSLYNSQIGVKLEKIILQALQKKVEKRFQSAGEMITELKKIHDDLGKAGQPEFSAIPQTQILDMPVVERRGFLKSPLKIIALLIVLLGLGISWVFLSGKLLKRHDVGAGGESQAVQVAADTRVPAGAEKTPGNANPGPTQGAEAENPLAAPATIPSEQKVPPSGTPPAGGEVKTGAPENAQTKAAENIPQQVPDKAAEKMPASNEKNQPPAEPLGSLDAELIRLRGFMARRNLAAADRLADALLQSGNESRMLPVLGNVKFLLNKFAAAEQLWLRSLQADYLVTLELIHLHDDTGDSCLGQLKFKKKVIMFSSDARGDHSFALQAGNVTSIRMGDGLRITIAATIGGQEMNESFMLGIKNNKLAKEQFLVDFLNKYVL